MSSPRRWGSQPCRLLRLCEFVPTLMARSATTAAGSISEDHCMIIARAGMSVRPDTGSSHPCRLLRLCFLTRRSTAAGIRHTTVRTKTICLALGVFGQVPDSQQTTAAAARIIRSPLPAVCVPSQPPIHPASQSISKPEGHRGPVRTYSGDIVGTCDTRCVP